MLVGTGVLIASGLAPLVSAHGWIKTITTNGQTISGWRPFDDPWSGGPEKPMRKFKSDGPVTDVSSKAITCNTNGATMNVPVGAIANDFKAGSDVTFHWTNWPSDHIGPVMTYLANCRGKCSDFDGSTGNVWFKIDEAGYENGRWASNRLIANGNSWTVKLPSTIAPGEYLLRHELLALHGARGYNGAQFYPSCTQIRVTSSGTENPPGVALPGAYSPTDPGILVDIWNGVSSYKIPGPPVWRDGSPSTASAGGVYGSPSKPKVNKPAFNGRLPAGGKQKPFPSKKGPGTHATGGDYCVCTPGSRHGRVYKVHQQGLHGTPFTQ